MHSSSPWLFCLYIQMQLSPLIVKLCQQLHSLLGALGEIFKQPSASAGVLTRGIMLIKIALEASISAVVLRLARVLAVPHPKTNRRLEFLSRRDVWLCVSFGSWIHFYLHIVVALKEVGDLAFAEFGVTELSCWGGAAQNELGALFWAELRALISIDQLLNSTHYVRNREALTSRQCQHLTSFRNYIIYITNSLL